MQRERAQRSGSLTKHAITAQLQPGLEPIRRLRCGELIYSKVTVHRPVAIQD
jgi:hypothetical protein